MKHMEWAGHKKWSLMVWLKYGKWHISIKCIFRVRCIQKKNIMHRWMKMNRFMEKLVTKSHWKITHILLAFQVRDTHIHTNRQRERKEASLSELWALFCLTFGRNSMNYARSSRCNLLQCTDAFIAGKGRNNCNFRFVWLTNAKTFYGNWMRFESFVEFSRSKK